jgi:amidophosphoribosyltransferase
LTLCSIVSIPSDNSTQEVDHHGNVIPAENGSPDWHPLNGTGAPSADEGIKPNGGGRSPPAKLEDMRMNSSDSGRFNASQDISLHNLNDHF